MVASIVALLLLLLLLLAWCIVCFLFTVSFEPRNGWACETMATSAIVMAPPSAVTSSYLCCMWVLPMGVACGCCRLEPRMKTSSLLTSQLRPLTFLPQRPLHFPWSSSKEGKKKTWSKKKKIFFFLHTIAAKLIDANCIVTSSLS